MAMGDVRCACVVPARRCPAVPGNATSLPLPGRAPCAAVLAIGAPHVRPRRAALAPPSSVVRRPRGRRARRRRRRVRPRRAIVGSSWKEARLLLRRHRAAEAHVRLHRRARRAGVRRIQPERRRAPKPVALRGPAGGGPCACCLGGGALNRARASRIAAQEARLRDVRGGVRAARPLKRRDRPLRIPRGQEERRRLVRPPERRALLRVQAAHALPQRRAAECKTRAHKLRAERPMSARVVAPPPPLRAFLVAPGRGLPGEISLFSGPK